MYQVLGKLLMKFFFSNGGIDDAVASFTSTTTIENYSGLTSATVVHPRNCPAELGRRVVLLTLSSQTILLFSTLYLHDTTPGIYPDASTGKPCHDRGGTFWPERCLD